MPPFRLIEPKDYIKGITAVSLGRLKILSTKREDMLWQVIMDFLSYKYSSFQLKKNPFFAHIISYGFIRCPEKCTILKKKDTQTAYFT